MLRRKLLFGFAALALLAIGQPARAGFVSNIDITNLGPVTVTGSTMTGVTAVQFSNLFTLMGNGAPFASEGLKLLGPATLTVANPAAFSFGTTGFGFFTGSSLMVEQESATSETFYVLGNFTVGTDAVYAGPPPFTGGPASFIFSITQNVGGGNSFTTSGNLALPPSVSVPEPASIAMLGLGLVAVGGLALRRRSAK